MNIEQKLTSIEVAEMVEKMHQELVLIRKELQAMNSKEFNSHEVVADGNVTVKTITGVISRQE